MKTTPTRLAALAAALTLSVLSMAGCDPGVTEKEEMAATSNDLSAGQLSGYNMADGTFALTFDDGPGDRTEELANWLGDRGIVATFFINGKNVPGHESALTAIRARGHILANHTQNHEDMTSLEGSALFHAVADTDAYIAAQQPSGPWLLRAPYGSWNQAVANELDGTSMSKYVGSIFWDIGGELTSRHAADWACWGQISVDDCAERYINEMNDRGSGISLMHDIHSKTVDMVKIIVNRMGASHFVSILKAPSIAAAVGNVPATPPPAPNAGGGNAPPPPSAGGGCGSVDYKGFCTQNTLTWCENDVLKTADCKDKGKVCSWKSDAEGHDCVAQSECAAGQTYRGSCDGQMLTWCDETGSSRQINCASNGRHCALENADTGFNCLP